jgi:hypothetical protein
MDATHPCVTILGNPKVTQFMCFPFPLDPNVVGPFRLAVLSATGTAPAQDILGHRAKASTFLQEFRTIAASPDDARIASR